MRRNQNLICSEETLPIEKPCSQSWGVYGGESVVEMISGRQVLSLEWNSEGVMDDETGESMEEEEETDVGSRVSEA